MSELSLDDLVANGTMSPEIAGTLRAIGRGRHGFLVVAIPRLAGKSTVMEAILAHAPAGSPRRTMGDDGVDIDALLAASAGGYFVVPEISQHPVTPGYIWGAPVRRIFAGLDGASVAAALHAGGAEEAFEVVCAGNAVPDEHAARIAAVVYIRSLGDDWQHPTGRRVTTVHEVAGVRGGRPQLRLLHRWDERGDRFENVTAPQRLATGRSR